MTGEWLGSCTVLQTPRAYEQLWTCGFFHAQRARAAFSIEAGGAWGPAAKRFFNECLELADGERNVDLYHWSSAKFSSTWYDTLSVLVAKGRAQVGVAASSGDWSKRIRDMQYTDHEDYTMGS